MNDPLALLSRDISNDRFVGCLYFEDRLNGEFRTVYLNDGASGAQVIELLRNPARQFDPPPPLSDALPSV